MSGVLIATLALIQAPTQFQVQRFVIRNVPASQLISRITRRPAVGGAPPTETGLQDINFLAYDPTDNSIVARGSGSALASLVAYLSRFDVPAYRVKLELRLRCEDAGLDSETTADLASNGSIRMAEPSAELEIELAPTVAADGTVSLSGSVSRWGKRVQYSLKVVEGEGMYFRSPLIGKARGRETPANVDLKTLGTPSAVIGKLDPKTIPPDLGVEWWVTVKQISGLKKPAG